MKALTAKPDDLGSAPGVYTGGTKPDDLGSVPGVYTGGRIKLSSETCPLTFSCAHRYNKQFFFPIIHPF